MAAPDVRGAGADGWGVRGCFISVLLMDFCFSWIRSLTFKTIVLVGEASWLSLPHQANQVESERARAQDSNELRVSCVHYGKQDS